MNNVVQLES